MLNPNEPSPFFSADGLGELHLQILTLFHDPDGWFRKHSNRHIPQFVSRVPRRVILLSAHPELREMPDVWQAAVRHLYAKGLLQSIDDEVFLDHICDKRTTALGDALLDRIET